MGRTQKSIKNICFGLTTQVITVFLSFVTRTCMIKLLGIEAVSINGLFSEVIAALSLAELGVGSAIVFNLYKPLADNDKEKVGQLMSLFKNAYRIIAAVTLVAGILICPWLHYFVNNLTYSMSYLRVVYILFVIQCASSYLFSYKTVLLEADQKTYINSQITAVFKIMGTIVLLFFLVTTRRYIVYLCTNIALTLGTNAFISHKVDKMYPYISEKYRLPNEEKKKVFSNIKNIFVKQLAGKVVHSTDNILISTLVSTILVGYYSNYAIIVGIFKQFSDKMSNSIMPSMGNLFVSESKEQCIKVLNRLTYIFYIFASISAIGTYACIQPFISMWLGQEYLMEKSIVFILIILLFFYISYKPLSMAMHLSGFFIIGRNISFVSAVVNLIVSIILGQNIGILGIFIGTFCTYVIEIASKIYYLYKLYFQSSVLKYALTWIKMIVVFLMSVFAVDKMGKMMIDFSNVNRFIIMGIFSVVVTTLFIILSSFKSDEFRYVAGMVQKIISKKTK